METTKILRRPCEGLSDYLDKIGKIPLLSASEEIELFRKIRSKKTSPLQKSALREKLIKANLRLVVHVAKSFRNSGVPLADLIGEGNVGLIVAVDKFDIKKKNRFSTYAVWWIRQAMRNITNASKTIRLPSYLVGIIDKWKHQFNSLLACGKNLTIEEIKTNLGISPSELRIIQRALVGLRIKIIGLDRAPEMGADTRDEKNSLTLETLIKLLGTLSEREAKILKLHFGLSEELLDPDAKHLTLQDIAKHLKLSRERVRQIEKNALKKLQDILVQGIL